MKYPKLENIKSRDDSDSWQVGFMGLRPKAAAAADAWAAAGAAASGMARDSRFQNSVL